MAAVGASRHSGVTMSVSMNFIQGATGPTTGGQHAAQPFYNPRHAATPAHTQEQVQPDRPIGYGAFGVVWSTLESLSWNKEGICPFFPIGKKPNSSLKNFENLPTISVV
ncbi:hypothetical protein WA026_022161 [Henosepilachna vigintioctopunctata]|uniref:Uncharacterized protein n=1 Tax=Henosepilachna vigintioctopunctata TaxID=420089 RepID=A0AAW1TPA0_9CUCU